MKCATCKANMKNSQFMCDHCTSERDASTASEMLTLSQTMVKMGIEVADDELTDKAKESLSYWAGEVIK